MDIKMLAKVGLLIALYYFSYYLFIGILHPIPQLGDSFDYHIPIEQSILDGTFLTLPHSKLPQWYYPGSSEAINALFILLHIPLTLSNLFAAVVLAICCFFLARRVKLGFWYSLLFAETIFTLNAIVRWFNAVSIDMWLAVFFVLAIILLERPQKTMRYVLSLGFVFGMLIGSKYTAWFFVIILAIMYWRTFKLVFNLQRVLIFLLPFSIFGLFWYVRNYLLVHNPFYPVPFLGFHGPLGFSIKVWQMSIQYPKDMVDALFGEYKLWLLSIPLGIVWLLQYFRKKKKSPEITKFFALGIVFVFFYTQFPTSPQPWIMVSSLRYSYPAFIPLILATFMAAKFYKKETLLGLLAIGMMLPVLTMTYYPKLVLIYLPLAFVLYRFFSRFDNDSG